MQTNYTLIETNKVVMKETTASDGGFTHLVSNTLHANWIIDYIKVVENVSDVWFTDPHKDAIASIYDFTLVSYASIYFSRD